MVRLSNEGTMNKAVFITSWPMNMGQGSGTALFVNALRQALQKTGTQVDLINPALDTTDYVQFTLDRLWFNTQLPQDPRPPKADWILGIDYDGFALPRRFDQPFIATARAVFADLVETEPEPFRSMLRTQAYFEKRNLRNANLVVTPSEYARRKAIEFYNLLPENIHAVPNGIDLAAWDAHWYDLPEPDPNRRPTVLAVSKLYPRKKIGLLVQAVPFIRARYPDVDVRIVGGGFEWDALQRLAFDIDVQDNLTWLGDVGDRRKVVGEYKNTHVFVHPSIQDAFANVCLESMASRRPLVVADAASMPEMVQKAGSGLITPLNDPQALAENIIRLLDDVELRRKYGTAGRRFAQTMTWQNSASRFIKLMNNLSEPQTQENYDYEPAVS
jgi:glycosyltransferase involved in cell wall biosynthesis